MADENDDDIPIAEDTVVVPRTPERAFVPMGEIRRPRPGTPAPEPEPRVHRHRPPTGVPRARVDATVVREFEHEIETKVSTGRRRMRWFANHLILFIALVAAAVPLRLTVYADLHEAFFYVPGGIWVALLAIHANYAMNPLMRKSARETQIKAVIPASEDDDTDEDGPTR